MSCKDGKACYHLKDAAAIGLFYPLQITDMPDMHDGRYWVVPGVFTESISPTKIILYCPYCGKSLEGVEL